MPCKLCGNAAGNTAYHVKEMLLGTKDKFDYFQCSSCGCLQIASIPETMDRYYPNTYYSFTELEKTKKHSLPALIRNTFVRMRDRYTVTNKGLVGKLLYALRPFPELRGLASCNMSTSTSILDVGCGTGSYLYKLKECGFDGLLGIDPYLAKTIRYANGLEIRKTDIFSVEGHWDVVMLHHSLEHMEKQGETLKKIASLLNSGGVCLIRIPTVTSDPWEEYRENWVHLDPPRHFFLHSHKSITELAERAGLSVDSITSDANAFSFYGSEFYRRGIPATEWKESMFTKSERKEFARKAEELNKKNRGDTIAVILRKS